MNGNTDLTFNSTQITIPSRYAQTPIEESVESGHQVPTTLTELYKATHKIRVQMEQLEYNKRTFTIVRDTSPKKLVIDYTGQPISKCQPLAVKVVK
jgi:hypothetical protein